MFLVPRRKGERNAHHGASSDARREAEPHALRTEEAASCRSDREREKHGSRSGRKRRPDGAPGGTAAENDECDQSCEHGAEKRRRHERTAKSDGGGADQQRRAGDLSAQPHAPQFVSASRRLP